MILIAKADRCQFFCVRVAGIPVEKQGRIQQCSRISLFEAYVQRIFPGFDTSGGNFEDTKPIVCLFQIFQIGII